VSNYKKVAPENLEIGDVIVRLDGEHEITAIYRTKAEISGNWMVTIWMEVRGRIHRMQVRGMQKILHKETA